MAERDFAWSAHLRRLVCDYERAPTVLAGLHFVVFACLMFAQLLHFISSPQQALDICPRGVFSVRLAVRPHAWKWCEMRRLTLG